ncbi:ABC transporter substrate-binding protein [Rhizobium sp.]|jgi:iron(III) transport system substrate-binding protein|uniref:ABC transporter substrate-binding protein n=1 Tax=Rhizobium sp. TaxID=391 RepID=UPI000E8A18FC|nr:ABC transporter substrate-binding protein [Rhizobium sp.]
MTLSLKTSLLALAASVAALSPASAADGFNLDALIAAAKTEAPINIYDSTGKIVEQAKAFSEKYGVKANGIKAKAPDILEIVSREAQAGNVKADVAILSDAPAAMQQLLTKGYAISWLPDDLAGDISSAYQKPLTVVLAPNVWTYNTSLYAACPVKNIWQLTEPQWKGKVSMQDPLGKPSYTDWFNQMATHYDKAIADAYQAEFGKPLQTTESSATAAFVKALAANGPLLTDSDAAAADAVGAPDVKDSFIGLVSTAKYRDNKKGMKLGICAGLAPFAGWNYPSLGLIAAGSKSPNTAKLFIHYMMTAEGIAPQAIDGKISTNTKIALPADEPSGIGKISAQIMGYDSSTAASDWQTRQDWQDLWSLNYKK